MGRPVRVLSCLTGAPRRIPYFKIGRLVRYDPMLVRDAIERKCLIALRHNDY